ncbi:hypothetical protein HZS_1944 [Henneguya salminicola]|nr:hypothetical protein HZS_1944 [Henneguya salminicola]
MIHDSENNEYSPCVFSFLTDKKRKNMFQKLFHELIPRYITIDFEKTLIHPVKHEFTECILVGCCFSLKQAIFKKLIKIVKNYNSSTNIIH